MKPLLFTLLACFVTACASKPKGPYFAVPTSPQDYRLVFAEGPVKKKAPQVLAIPEADLATMERIRPKLVELQAGKPPLPEIGQGPAGVGYFLQGSEDGKWRSLGVVDREGQVVKVASDDSVAGPKIKDARATRVLKKQVLAMQKAAVVGGPVVPVGPTPTATVIRPGYVKSPFDPAGGPVDVRGLPSGTEVEDPYVPSRTFLVP